MWAASAKALTSVLYTSILFELFTTNINLSITSVFKEIKVKTTSVSASCEAPLSHHSPLGLLWETVNDFPFTLRAAATSHSCSPHADPLCGPWATHFTRGRSLHGGLQCKLPHPHVHVFVGYRATINSYPSVSWSSAACGCREKNVSCLLLSNMLGCPGAFMKPHSVLRQEKITAGWSMCLLPTVTPGELVVGVRDAQESSDI